MDVVPVAQLVSFPGGPAGEPADPGSPGKMAGKQSSCCFLGTWPSREYLLKIRLVEQN